MNIGSIISFAPLHNRKIPLIYADTLSFCRVLILHTYLTARRKVNALLFSRVLLNTTRANVM